MTIIEIEIYPDGRMDTANTAKYLGLSQKTLAMWRCQGISPPFIKLGNRVFYQKQQLDEWISEHPSQTSSWERGDS